MSPFLESRYRAAARRFRRYVPHHEDPRVAPLNRPSVISATLSPSPWPTMAAVTPSISRHPRAAGRAFIAHYHHVAGLDAAFGDGLHRRFFSIEDTRRTGDGDCVRGPRLSGRILRAPDCPLRITRPPVDLIVVVQGVDDLSAPRFPALWNRLSARVCPVTVNWEPSQ